MKKRHPHNRHISSRQSLLNSPVEIMPIPGDTAAKLAQMGFITVREAFRAALAGRLATRKKGGARLEDSVLGAGCSMLGYIPLSRKKIRDFRSTIPGETISQSLERFCGANPVITGEQRAISCREILLPVIMHNNLITWGLHTLGDILDAKTSLLLEQERQGGAPLGSFLVHLFDYLFILNDPATGNDKGITASPPQSHRNIPGESDPLSSWLNHELLAAGKELQANGQPENLLIFRHTAGGIFRENNRDITAYLSLKSEPGNASLRTLVLAGAGCDECYPASHYQSGCCRHVAALAVYLLAEQESEATNDLPKPLLYQQSPWFLIGNLLYELFGSDHQLEASTGHLPGSWHLSIAGNGDKPLAEWYLDEKKLTEALELFPRQIKLSAKHKPATTAPPLRDLWSKLLDLGRSSTEVELNGFNQKTSAQECEESIWHWLGISMHQLMPASRLQLTGPDGEGLFSLQAENLSGQKLFHLTLPRAKTPDLVDALASANGTSLLSAAKSFTSMSMAEDGTVTTETMLQLEDGRVLERKDLAANRYGRYYYLAGTGFFPVAEQDQELALDQDPETGASFPAEKVPDLLREYHAAFHASENLVDEKLLALDFREQPDQLQVDSFNTDSDWCYLSGHYGLGNRRISLVELLERRRDQRKFVVGGAKWLKLTDTPLDWFHNLDQNRLWHDDATGERGVRLTRREMLMLSVLVPEVRIQTNTRGGNILNQLLETGRWANSDQLPDLPPHLRDYQKHGVAWLNQLYHNRLAGILADDMGLGKTHQTLALFDLVRRKHPDRRFLVICPATVVPHWEQKIEDFFPGLSHYIYHGSRRDLEKAGECDVCLTTYGIIRRDGKALSDLDFEIIIFDEIQQLKNRKTDVHRAATRLKASVVIGLTGTPLENSVYDLKAIFDICLPGYLGSDRDFKTRYADPIANNSDQKSRQALARLINPFILRRTREQVLPELPEVIEDLRTCHLSDDQVTLYRELINGHRQALMTGEDPESEDSGPQYMELLAIINYLKQVCNHPCLIKKCREVERFRSGKWDLFVELLGECLDGGMKVVVFSHYTSMLDLIEQYLNDQGITHCGLRGEMPMSQRHKMIKKFNTDESCQVFTASLLTGGIGVDLTAARAVIHYDRWWNAAREDQATARVHRMGQKHVVQVFKLITVGTLEEKINQLIARKKDLAAQMIRKDDAAIIKRLSREELLDLLTSPKI